MASSIKEGCTLSLNGTTLHGTHSPNCPEQAAFNLIQVRSSLGTYRYCARCRCFQHIPFRFQAKYIVTQFHTEPIFLLAWHIEVHLAAEHLQMELELSRQQQASQQHRRCW